MPSLSGKVAIVTGAAGAGIGQAAVRAFAKEGANVVVSDAHPKRPFSVAEDIAKTVGVKAIGFQCDVSNRQQVENMVKGTLDAFGRIDILVNNAGINQLQPVWEMSDENWNLVLGVNLTGTFYCTRAVLPTMIKQRSGKIVSMASVAGWIGSADGEAHYCAAKAGVMAFTRCVARETAQYGINVYAIAPGLVYNEFLARIYPAESLERVKKETPLGRYGTPQDIANLMLFLISDGASFITGETICISGGLYFHA